MKYLSGSHILLDLEYILQEDLRVLKITNYYLKEVL